VLTSMDGIRQSVLSLRILAAAVALSVLVGTPARAQYGEPLLDPIPEKPIQSRLGLIVEEFAAFPKSEPTPAPTDPRLMRHARINYLGEIPDGSGRLFVPDLNGTMYLVVNGGVHPYLDVAGTFAPQFFSGRGLGQGFGFVTFHPEFASNGRFYTVHTERASATLKTPDLTPQPNTVYHGIVTEWTADDPSADVFQGTCLPDILQRSCREILRIGFAGQIHGIQQIDFNPTARPGDEDYGLLYLAIGDGGQGVRSDHPQNLAMPHGKIFRIDPQGRDSANRKYGIPPTNPFVGKPGVLGEIYAVGMRDPHRFSWDPRAGNRMFLGHIGEHAIEAIYEVRAGDNFGWSEREGAFVFDKAASDPCARIYPLPPDDEKYGYTYPLAAYDHDPPPTWNCTSDVGVAVVGGFVYRGQKVPELAGKYIFGDIVDGQVFYTNAGEMRRGNPHRAHLYQLMLFDKTGKWVTMQQLAGDQRVDLRFGRDGEGELYLLAKANGRIWKVVGTREFASCDIGGTTVTGVMSEENWAPVTPEKWQFPGSEVILAEPGVSRPGPRRPFEYAVLSAGPAFRSVEIEAEVRIDTPVEIRNRDVIIVFGYRSDTEFYYAHLSTDNTIYPHNGIFVVNNADRLRIDHQWNGLLGAPPAIPDAEWHRVRLVHCPESGEIAVYVDGSENPLITATDTTLGSGRVGFGSFDNIGRLRNLTVTGTPAEP
jgi:hypothetical protein